MLDTDQERALIRESRAGGAGAHAAYAQLVSAHQAWLVRYLLYLLGDIGDAEDVAQETFVRAYTKLHGFRGESPFRGWLRRMATRQAFNFQRDRRTRRGYEQRAPHREQQRSSESSVIAREALMVCLSRIAYPYREVLLLRYVEELAVKEIANVLSLGESATKMRLARAREAFWNAHVEVAANESP